MKSIKGAVVLAAVILSSLLFQSPASAHTASVYYHQLWPNGTDVVYGFESSFPSGSFRARVHDARKQWTWLGANTVEPDFFHSLTDGNYGSPANPCARTRNSGAFYWRDLDYLGSGVMGAARICATSTTIYSFTIEFDNDRDWYSGTNDVPCGFPMPVPQRRLLECRQPRSRPRDRLLLRTTRRRPLYRGRLGLPERRRTAHYVPQYFGGHQDDAGREHSRQTHFHQRLLIRPHAVTALRLEQLLAGTSLMQSRG